MIARLVWRLVDQLGRQLEAKHVGSVSPDCEACADTHRIPLFRIAKSGSLLSNGFAPCPVCRRSSYV